jgi:acetyl esterase/lipase
VNLSLPQRFLSTGHQLSRTVRHDLVDLTPQQIRMVLDNLARLNPGPFGGTFEVREVGGVQLAVVRYGEVKMPARILMIHGGGFAFGSSRTHRALAVHLAKATGCEVWIPDYALSPENPFPAGLNDVLSIYERLIIDVGDVIVVGDSAGGNLAMASVQQAIQRGWERPAGLALLSPWLDLRPDSESNRKNEASLSPFDRKDMCTYADFYRGEVDTSDPRISPILGGTEGFPPTHLQFSEVEFLYHDTVALQANLNKSRIPVETHKEPHALHAWQLFPDVLPEARRSLRALAAFVNRINND